MRINSSRAALIVSFAALFVAMGGTAVAVTQIGTSQIKNGAVTRSKLHKGAVGTSKLANNAVTAAKVAPNTFLPANGTAVDSSRLGGLLPTDFLQGVGIMEDRRVVVPAGESIEFLDTGFGTFTGNCTNSGQMNVTWSPTVTDAEYEATMTTYPSTVSMDTLNGISAGGSANDPVTATSGPLSTSYQIGYTSGLDHVATAWVTARFEFGTGCVFIGQEVSSG